MSERFITAADRERFTPQQFARARGAIRRMNKSPPGVVTDQEALWYLLDKHEPGWRKLHDTMTQIEDVLNTKAKP